ncbi:MAG: hypothetical protein IPN29_18025 [Saprospiraceae bacterium]|nr:hypothetical protein [Saprospiraceae bacterium]
MKYIFLLLHYGFFFLLSHNSWSQDTSKLESPARFNSRHEIVLNGKKMMYQAHAGETYLANDSGQVVGAIFSVHYALDEVKPVNGTSRPVTFVFNGGPGSASVWLHLGLLGPRLIDVDSEAKRDDGAAPFDWRTNPYFLIEHTDLVFVDPIGTGYSTAKGKAKNEQFWGLKEDAVSLANFIRTWVSQNKRWQSKKYIIGESFGTTRAAAIVNELEKGGQQMSLNGLVLISQALDYAGSTSVHDNITSYITYLPSMAATAWYHKRPE